MSSIPTQIRIDSKVKEQASIIFNSLGLGHRMGILGYSIAE